jgi:hypothetical protein
VGTLPRLPHPLREVMPSILQDVLVDFWWDQQRLWRLDLPVSQVPVAHLRWHLQLPLWSHEGNPFTITPDQVAACPQRFPEHHARTLAADPSLPLHLLDRPQRLTILDGAHRLLKAHLTGRHAVLAKKVPLDRLDNIAHR